MKRTFVVKLHCETDEPIDLIEHDLKQEISCCWNDFYIDEIIEKKEKQNNEDNA